MKTPITVIASGLILAVPLLCSSFGEARADDGDPPARVARVSDAEGAVALEPAGMQQWTPATLNRPLTTGDRLWSDQNSRAELDIGAAVARLGSVTGFAFLNLDDRSAQMQLSSGTLIVRVRDMQPGDNYEIDTPNLAVSLQQPGEYRVEADDRGEVTVVKVSEGAALTADGSGQQIAIGAQQQLTVGGHDAVAYDSSDLAAPDGFDNWSAARERQLEDAASSEYVASDLPGTQDLDDNGRWEETPEYGYVWIPTAVAVGWVPYRYGHWLWVRPWGWTWVDDAPWGFAPFHYGRWTQCGGRWCWVPGPRRARPIYAPAVVAWVGGAALGASGHGSNVGWFPLAPHEVYVPAYRASSNYVSNINTTNTSRITSTYVANVYQDRITPTHYANNRAAAVTAVPQAIFISGQSAARHAAALTTALLAESVVRAAAPAISPVRQSVLGPAGAHGVVTPSGRANRPVLARTAPPPSNFDAQLSAAPDGARAPEGTGTAQVRGAVAVARVRIAPMGGPVVVASALTHRPSPAAVRTAREPTLAERERALEVSRLPSAHRPSSGSTSTGSAPDNSSSHPTPPQRESHQDQPAIPVYHPPPAPDAYSPAHTASRADESHGPAARPPAPSAPGRAAPSHPQGAKASASAAHQQREPPQRLTR